MKKTISSPEIFIDLVCMMQVASGNKNLMFTYQMRTYYFCTEACRKAFATNPDKYLESMSPKRRGWWGRYLERLNKVTGSDLLPCHSKTSYKPEPKIIANKAFEIKKSASPTATVIDPVCGMKIAPGNTDLVAVYQGDTYYFCAETCRKAFETNPHDCLKPKHDKRKNLWERYLERLGKVTGGRSLQCH